MLQTRLLFHPSRSTTTGPMATVAAAAMMLCVTAAPTRADDAQDSGNQLHTLTAPPAPRFEITDRTWPAEVGDADVCLWQDDKLAAISFTIDDNTKPDHDWWLDFGEANGWKFTWFVITGMVDKSPGYFGTWADFKHLLEEGHDVQSHSVTHLDPARGYTGNIADEYAPSVAALEENLPGHKVTTFAYPNGLNPNNDNDAELAAEVFNAARGVQGLLNAANTINYNDTNSVNTRHIGAGEWSSIENLLDPAGYSNGLNYRGWFCTHSHKLSDAEKETLTETAAYIKEHEDDLWVGLFREVALYGMERDTATLTAEAQGDDRFTLSVTDQMDDALFEYPLTVKLRVPDGWTDATVTQGDRVRAAAIVEHDGKTFALAPVVPDAGDAVVTEGAPPEPEAVEADDNEGDSDAAEASEETSDTGDE